MKRLNENTFLILVVIVFIILCINPFLIVDKQKRNINEYENIRIFDFDESKYTHFTVSLNDTGEDIYVPNSSTAYHYGPSLIINEDGSIDEWFATPGNMSSEWDYIRYRHSSDGYEYDKEEIVLKPTKNSKDHYSVCDPGVIYFNGYYYLAYTSTCNGNKKGYDNNIFVSRSENPNGPFEKWNGEGWGGNPEPIVINPDEGSWGVGEPCFVIKDDTLFMYYSAYITRGSMTMVVTSNLNEDWPLSISEPQIAFNKIDGQDSNDVIYLEENEIFLSLSVGDRTYDSSFICVYESKDGINFERTDKIKDNFLDYAHSLGVTKRKDGHVVESEDNLLLGYAYGQTWGKWATRLVSINIETYKGEKH